MKPSEAKDLANQIRGLSTAIQVIGQNLMATNAIRGRQLLKISDTMDTKAAEIHRKWGDAIRVPVKICLLQEDGSIVAVMPEQVMRSSKPGMVACYALMGQHSTGSMDYFRGLPKVKDGEAKAAFLRHFTSLYECLDFIEVDIHDPMAWEET